MPSTIYGRTLVELISALAIIALFMTIALPNLREFQEEHARTQAVNQLVSALHYARGKAVFSRRITTLCHGDLTCEDEQRWQGNLLIFLDHNANGQLDTGDELLYQLHVPEEFSWHWNRSRNLIQFEADGTTRALNGTFTLCHNAVPRSQVVVSLSGRTRKQAPKNGASC